MWDGFWFLSNRASWEAMPASTRDIITKVVNESALKQRADVEKLNGDLRKDIEAKGVQFIDVKPDAFRQRLREGGFYQEWKGRMGEQAWALLEGTTGKLA